MKPNIVRASWVLAEVHSSRRLSGEPGGHITAP